MKTGYYYQLSILGEVGIAEEDGWITNVFFGQTVQPDTFEVAETALLKTAFIQLEEYFAGRRRVFELPLKPEGGAFEKSVWEALLGIPYGETRTYGEIAAQIGNPKASRAVGGANGRNPISIFIPCHRVIGAGGRMVGYAGGKEIKRRLLALEKGKI